MAAESTDWSYGPSTGNIVCDTNSVHDHLPKFTKDIDIIGLEFDLPAEQNGSFTFIVDGARTPTKPLRLGNVADPGVFLLKKRTDTKFSELNTLELTSYFFLHVDFYDELHFSFRYE